MTATVPAPMAHTMTTLQTTIPRRPSPWHEIAHSLTASLPPSHSRSRSSSTSTHSPPDDIALSTSSALREWEARLSHPASNAIRHQLSFPRRKTSTPKLAAERDKAGYIEYKLKLIDPTPDRFERLVTQMMWRLKQGRNEAIYEIGLADDGTVIGLTRNEMDASLHTLELMASEVGATVLVLKEIVLHTHVKKSAVPLDPTHTPDLDADELDKKKSARRKTKRDNKQDQELGRVGDLSDDSPFEFPMDDVPSKKDDKKRRKSLARQEERRLDLLRGDGTNALWQEHSSLRLTTPPPDSEPSFLDDLLHIPLDSLSLSFADVISPSSSDHTEAEEMICVEALVVRKVQYDSAPELEEGEWGFGGEEDVWGFGGEDE